MINRLKLIWTLLRHGNLHRYPTSFQATDCVIRNIHNQQLLVGRKKGSKLFRFVGGFVDPKDQSLEDACQREKFEESGVFECSRPKYLFSFRVKDPRYINSIDKVMTAVFICEYIFGKPEAGDDIEEVAWVGFTKLKEEYKEIIAPEHFPIVEYLIKNNII